MGVTSHQCPVAPGGMSNAAGGRPVSAPGLGALLCGLDPLPGCGWAPRVRRSGRSGARFAATPPVFQGGAAFARRARLLRACSDPTKGSAVASALSTGRAVVPRSDRTVCGAPTRPAPGCRCASRPPVTPQTGRGRNCRPSPWCGQLLRRAASRLVLVRFCTKGSICGPAFGAKEHQVWCDYAPVRCGLPSSLTRAQYSTLIGQRTPVMRGWAARSCGTAAGACGRYSVLQPVCAGGSAHARSDSLRPARAAVEPLWQTHMRRYAQFWRCPCTDP